MVGSGFAFEVRLRELTAYAEVLRAGAAEMQAVGAAVAGMRVEAGWFGKLPEAEVLADRCGAERDGVVAEVGELGAWLGEAGWGLVDSAGRYSGADRVVAEAALGVGIEIPGAGGESGDGDGGANSWAGELSARAAKKDGKSGEGACEMSAKAAEEVGKASAAGEPNAADRESGGWAGELSAGDGESGGEAGDLSGADGPSGGGVWW